MIEEKVGLFKYRKMIKESNDFILERDGRCYKLDPSAADEMLNHFKVSIDTSEIDPHQISWLSDKAKYIDHSYLPCGVLKYGINTVGVIYPKFFEGYKTFENLNKEDNLLIMKNLRKALLNNRELLNNDIYNTDFAFKNIMYKGNDVELVDLDGKCIKRSDNCSYAQVYSYYLHDLERLFKDRVSKDYSQEEKDKIINKYLPLFRNITYDMNMDYPFEVLDEVEKVLVLK